MARASAAAEAAALNGLDGTGSTNLIGFVALNTGDPGTTGASENASSGGYARQACTWNAANTGTGTKTNATALTFATLGTIAVSHFSAWSLVSAGAFAIAGALGSSVTAASITIAAGAITLSAT